jgi:hypothetical protein
MIKKSTLVASHGERIKLKSSNMSCIPKITYQRGPSDPKKYKKPRSSSCPILCPAVKTNTPLLNESIIE